MKALEKLQAQAKAELAANPRLRAGLWLALGIGLLWGLLAQAERLAAAQEEYAAEASRLMEAQALLKREDWAQLLAEERIAGNGLREAFWQAETQGLAQAQLQAALANMASRLHFRNLRVQLGVSQPLPEAPGFWQVQAQLSGLHDPGAELQALHAIATHPKKLVTDRLDLDRRNSRMLLTVSALFSGIQDIEPEGG